MPGKQAKVITPSMLRRMLRYAARSPFPLRDRVIVLLSVKAGLRACEIAKLNWSMVLDATGAVGEGLVILNAIAKRRSGRRIPIHPDLKAALQRLLRVSEPSGPVIRSARGGHMRPSSIVNWFAFLFADLGFEGCSSHSGRAPSSPGPPETSTASAAVYATSRCSLVTGRSRRPRATSTAIRLASGDWSGCSDPLPLHSQQTFPRHSPLMESVDAPV